MKLSMVGIIVEDIEVSIKFYNLIGLELEQRYSDNYVELKHDLVRISLNTKTMIESVYGFKPDIRGQRIELAFELNDKEELDKHIQKIKDNNYKIIKEPWRTDWHQYYCLIEDVDGNIISLFTAL